MPVNPVGEELENTVWKPVPSTFTRYRAFEVRK